MTFKRIYIEITNVCNLKCDFCIQNTREKQFMSLENFNQILDKIKNHTNYIYLHILGEPLMNKDINLMIDSAKDKNINVNITTNGYLINKIKNNKNIRQVNISLHSFNEKYNIDLKEYLNNIKDTIEELINNDTQISLRLWVKSKYTEQILEYLNNEYNKNIKTEDLIKNKNITIKDKLYLSINDEFIWPDLNNNYYNETGKCYALKDHIGILVDGTIIPCCLDTKGIINLGNIYENNIDEILNNERVINMKSNFQNNKKCEELCKHCKYL